MLLGFIYACVAAVTYATISLFSLPLIHEGISFVSTTFYRFLFSAIVIFFISLLCKKSLVISKKDFLKCAAVGFFYVTAALTFVAAFYHMDSGIVGTVQFAYPLFVILMMVLFFGEKFRFSTMAAAVVIVIGVGIFSIQGTEHVRISLWGMTLTLFSSLLLSLYILGIQEAKFESKSNLIICGYIMLLGALQAGIYGLFTADLQWISTQGQWKNILLLALISGVLSNICMIFSIKRIGPSLASIFNGLEPVTVMALGVVVFNEKMTWHNAWGAACIIGAVLFVAVRSHLREKTFLQSQP